MWLNYLVVHAWVTSTVLPSVGAELFLPCKRRAGWLFGLHIYSFLSYKPSFKAPVDCWLCDPRASALKSRCFHLCVCVSNTNVLSASPVQHDELREIFNDISSSSEDEEDEGDRHEDEDLNIMDTEDDLVQQLQDKLNESDSAQNESDRNNQIGMRQKTIYKSSYIVFIAALTHK